MGLFDLFKAPKSTPIKPRRTKEAAPRAKSRTKPTITTSIKKLSAHLEVSGESQKNSDGADRQHILAGCKEGDSVRLVREAQNQYDSSAIAVITSRGQVGYVPREDAKRLAPLLDHGFKASAKIAHIGGDTKDKLTRGVWLKVDWQE